MKQMVDLDWKTKMISSDLVSSKSPRLSDKLQTPVPPAPAVAVRVSDLSPASDSACSTYEHYLRLPELRKLWSSRDFPSWEIEPVLKPALQGLEISFRLISTVLSDPRPYANRREWKRRLESLSTSQVEIVALLCEEAEEDVRTRGTAPIVDATSNSGAETWKLTGVETVVSSTSVASLLPRLARWDKSKDVAEKILYSIDCEMRMCPYTLGLGEPNLGGKPSLQFDKLCNPAELHSLRKTPFDQMKLDNFENQRLYEIHQISESWIYTSRQLLNRIAHQIEQKSFESASSHCWLLEKVWKLLSQIEDLHLLMDPDDFLRLKSQLSLKATSERDLFCFRSRGLVEITTLSKDLRNKVPDILEVEVDPQGGPRIQEAAMELYRKRSGGYGRIHLLQAMQGVETAVKGFYYAYRQRLVVVMGSVEAKGNRGFVVGLDSGDELAQIFLEPTYFPSLDAAKTFLGEYWTRWCGGPLETRKK